MKIITSNLEGIPNELIVWLHKVFLQISNYHKEIRVREKGLNLRIVLYFKHSLDFFMRMLEFLNGKSFFFILFVLKRF